MAVRPPEHPPGPPGPGRTPLSPTIRPAATEGEEGAGEDSPRTTGLLPLPAWS